jgi:hypothetical protein
VNRVDAALLALLLLVAVVVVVAIDVVDVDNGAATTTLLPFKVAFDDDFGANRRAADSLLWWRNLFFKITKRKRHETRERERIQTKQIMPVRFRFQ